jgi:nitrite reductase/ring-hydroxylating ferredoxin subunit
VQPAAPPFDTGLTPEVAHRRLVVTPWGERALFRRSDGAFVAVEAWCPHVDGPLWEGTLGARTWNGDDELACPWHAWRFSLHDGRCTWAPPADSEEARGACIRLEACTLGPGGTLLVLPP